jgi:hypothetical protein
MLTTQAHNPDIRPEASYLENPWNPTPKKIILIIQKN